MKPLNAVLRNVKYIILSPKKSQKNETYDIKPVVYLYTSDIKFFIEYL